MSTRVDGGIPPVTMVSVPSRAALCEATCAEWARIGLPNVQVWMTPATLTPSPGMHGLMLRLALRAALELCPGLPVLFSEDDLVVDDRLRDWLPGLVEMAAAGVTLTLYLPGMGHYPARARRLLAPTTSPDRRPACPWVWPIVGQQRWIGSQCLLLPPPVAAHVARMDDPERLGGDLLVRRALAERGERLHAVIPNPVQHRGGPSATSARYKPHTSATFGFAAPVGMGADDGSADGSADGGGKSSGCQ